MRREDRSLLLVDRFLPTAPVGNTRRTTPATLRKAMPPFSLCPPRHLGALALLGFSISSGDTSRLTLAQEAV